jgi:hypothetical protein
MAAKFRCARRPLSRGRARFFISNKKSTLSFVVVQISTRFQVKWIPLLVVNHLNAGNQSECPTSWHCCDCAKNLSGEHERNARHERGESEPVRRDVGQEARVAERQSDQSITASQPTGLCARE